MRCGLRPLRPPTEEWQRKTEDTAGLNKMASHVIGGHAEAPSTDITGIKSFADCQGAIGEASFMI